jgi:DNA-binding IclR family transcriptional regulator
VQQTGLTAHLALISQAELVLIDKISPPESEPLPTWIGKRLPIHCTATGKVLMAYMPEEQLEHHIQQGFIRYNENTIVSAARLKQELKKIRLTGLALDDEEETLGLRCIGAAVFDAEKKAVAAISVAGTTTEINEDTLKGLAPLIKATAEAISLSMHVGQLA